MAALSNDPAWDGYDRAESYGLDVAGDTATGGWYEYFNLECSATELAALLDELTVSLTATAENARTLTDLIGWAA